MNILPIDTLSYQEETLIDAYKLLIGEMIGHGESRTVFSCTLNPNYVVKIERLPSDGVRTYHNVLEWSNHLYACEHLREWLAPIHFISPNGILLIMDKGEKITDKSVMPSKIPSIFMDTHINNFALFDGKVKIVDYPFLRNEKFSLVKKKWK